MDPKNRVVRILLRKGFVFASRSDLASFYINPEKNRTVMVYPNGTTALMSYIPNTFYTTPNYIMYLKNKKEKEKNNVSKKVPSL